LFIDETTAQRIGLDRVLHRLQPLSPYGKLMKEKQKYFAPGCEDILRREWQRVHSLVQAWDLHRAKFQNVELVFHTLRDIRAVVRKACNGYVLEDVDLYEIKSFIQGTRELEKELSEIWAIPPSLRIPPVPQLWGRLALGGEGGFYLDDSFALGLASLRRQMRQLQTKLAGARREAQLRIAKETGRSFNHLGRLRVSKLDTEILEQLARRRDLLLASETYMEVEYVLRDSQDMVALGGQLQETQQRIEALEHRVRKELTQSVVASSRRLLAACRRLGGIDLLLAKARLARETGGSMPELQAAPLELESFVNPVVNEFLAEQGLSFQPLSLKLGTTVTVITGANMGGKSVSLKSLGLAVAMAQWGLLVPAHSFRFSLRSFVFYSQQDEDPGQGLSTFGTEINSLAEVLPRRNEPGLFLLDEPARGTNPWEGSALVKGLIAWLREGSSLALVATHFPGLFNMEQVTHLQVAGLAEANLEQLEDLGAEGIRSLQELMDYSLVPGHGKIPRDALKVAAFLGLDPEILSRAAQELES